MRTIRGAAVAFALLLGGLLVSSAAASDPTQTRIGLFYLTFHCGMFPKTGGVIYDNTKILSGQGSRHEGRTRSGRTRSTPRTARRWNSWARRS